MPNFEKPILFSETMVQAILDGRKSQTRRVMKPQPECKGVLEITAADEVWYIYPHGDDGEKDYYCKFPYAHRLWVRETWDVRHYADRQFTRQVIISYGADGFQKICQAPENWNPTTYNYPRWRPSIHMPRWASRLLLDVVRIRVERVQDITEADCAAEGIAGKMDLIDRFAFMWDEINAARGFGWDVNPWVWVLEFKPVEVING